MITRCGWCGKLITDDGGADSSRHPVSTGICPDCVDNFDFQAGVDMQRFLDSLTVPVALVGQNGSIQQANGILLSLLGKKASEIQGVPGGNVFECAYARLPEGCGNTVHCSGCAIRRTVMNTFNTGENSVRVPAFLKRSADGAYSRFSMLISTEKLGSFVLLEIDPIFSE